MHNLIEAEKIYYSNMKIIYIGAEGKVGSCAYEALKEQHEVITAGRTTGSERIDITSEDSIIALFEKVGKVDAIVNAAGAAKWEAFENLTEEDFYVGIKSKMMGQVNLVRVGATYLNEGGSITLTTGILADDPVNGACGAALVNGGINAFVKAVSREALGKFRINVVSPGLLEKSAEALGDWFPGHIPVSTGAVAAGYLRSVLGNVTGEVIRVQ